MSVEEFGRTVQGAGDISQCILIIIATRKGTDPFRPDFGSNIWNHIDQPLQVAATAMVREIREAADRWEPRVRVRSVSYDFASQEVDDDGTPSQIIFHIGWELAGGTVSGQTDILFGLEEGPDAGDIPPAPVLTVLSTEMGDPLASENNELLLVEP